LELKKVGTVVKVPFGCRDEVNVRCNISSIAATTLADLTRELEGEGRVSSTRITTL
jgi:hypothetical protein